MCQSGTIAEFIMTDFVSPTMSNETIQYEPIGRIHSPFESVDGMPIQSAAATDVTGRVELDAAYADGLDDLDGFSHCILLYHFDRATEAASLAVRPFLDDERRGLFATRAPQRPNPIGLSVVEIDGRDGSTLAISGVDVLDGTPLLDVKPYVPQFDAHSDAKTGWLEETPATADDVAADSRFRQ